MPEGQCPRPTQRAEDLRHSGSTPWHHAEVSRSILQWYHGLSCTLHHGITQWYHAICRSGITHHAASCTLLCTACCAMLYAIYCSGITGYPARCDAPCCYCSVPRTCGTASSSPPPAACSSADSRRAVSLSPSPGWSTAVESAALEAARSSTRGSGWVPVAQPLALGVSCRPEPPGAP